MKPAPLLVAFLFTPFALRAIDYPYQTAEPQKTGWPLTTAERAYIVDKPEHEARCRAMGITDFKKVYRSKDLASGENIIFAATGVTDGTLMKGVRYFGDGIRTSSIIMQNNPHRIRFIDSINVTKRDVKVFFN